jgi:hypothetical protein
MRTSSIWIETLFTPRIDAEACVVWIEAAPAFGLHIDSIEVKTLGTCRISTPSSMRFGVHLAFFHSLFLHSVCMITACRLQGPRSIVPQFQRSMRVFARFESMGIIFF